VKIEKLHQLSRRVNKRLRAEPAMCVNQSAIVLSGRKFFIGNPLVRIHLIIEMTLVDRLRAMGD